MFPQILDYHVFCTHFLYKDQKNHIKIPQDAPSQKKCIFFLQREISKILCIPYYPTEFHFSVTLKDQISAPLCTFLMDDQNIYSKEVKDRDVKKLLDKSDLILAISPEMAKAYSEKYQKEVLFFPPFVTTGVPFVESTWESLTSNNPPRGAMIGNVWSQKRFSQMLDLLGKTRMQIDWYGHGGRAPWLQGSREEWAKNGLHYHGWLEEGDLLAKLAGYPFILLPSGEMDESDDKLSFSRLSLPSRLVFLNARVGVPVLVLGHPQTAAARFVRRFGTGISTSGKPELLQEAANKLLQNEFRAPLLANLKRYAHLWSHDHPGEVIWEALAGNRQKILEAEYQKFLETDFTESMAISGLPRTNP